MDPLYNVAICSATHLVLGQFDLFLFIHFFEHIEFLLRPIGLYLGNSCLFERNSKPLN